MDSEILLEKYKMAKSQVKITIWVMIALITPPLYYWDAYELVTSEFAQEQIRLQTLTNALQMNLKKTRELPNLEKRYEVVQQQLQQAKKALPEYIVFEMVLQKVATLAQEAGVNLVTFDPEQGAVPSNAVETGEPKKSGDNAAAPTKTLGGNSSVKYMQHNINLRIEGKYEQIALFFDRIGRLQSSVFIENFSIKYSGSNMAAKRASANNSNETDLRDALNLLGELSIAIYRSPTEDEEKRYFPG